MTCAGSRRSVLYLGELACMHSGFCSLTTPSPLGLILSFYTDCGLFDPLPLRISKDPLCVGGALPIAAYDDAYSSY